MPSLMEMKMRLVCPNDIIGQLALNAVKQHPYHRPDGLFDLAMEVLDICKRDFKDGIEYFPTRWFASNGEIYQWLIDAIWGHPTLKEWNTPKSKHTGHVFTSRYDSPAPENDFIDIEALLQNIALGVWRDAAEYEKAA